MKALFRKMSRAAAALAAGTLLGGVSGIALGDAGDVDDVGEVAFDETPRLWFVELNSAPTVDGTNPATLAAEKQAFRESASRAGLAYQERYSFATLWNGLSVQINPDHVTKLARVPGVKAIYPVITYAPPERSNNPGTELVTALAQTGANLAQSALGLSGDGIKVAVMDTGIDYDHPDLGGCFGPGCRVATGWDFVGDTFNADDTSPAFNPIPSPDADPDDCNGHGSHVSGIVGANGTVKGVAPKVTFGAYRVFGCAGSTTAEIMIAAMERALADDMDVLNMSIGSAFQWPQYPTAVAASKLVNKGMVVVASIGNSGASGLYSASAPGLGKNVIGVAAFDNTHVLQPVFTVSPDNRTVGYSSASGAPPAPQSGSFPMSRTGTQTSAADACAALPAGSLTGTVALVRRGTCSFYIKAFNAQAAGAAGVVLYNNVAGFVNPTVAGTPPITIPVVMAVQAEGNLIDTRLAAGPVTLTWTSQQVSTPNPTGNLISSFSSFGLSPDLALKPDIGAPGGLINSTFPLELGGFATISGTSMASPHVAGSVALLLQSKPHTKAGSVRDILQNSADPKPWFGNPGLGFLDNVHRQGAGMLDIDDAILATTRIVPGKLSLGESEAGAAVRKLAISNRANFDVTYDVSFVNALSTGGTITPSFTTSDATVTFSESSITVPAHGEVCLESTITAPTGPNQGQYGGYIVLTPQDGGQTYRVPYAGFIGDYQSIVVLMPTANGFPWLAKLSGTIFTNQPSGATYTLVGQDVPQFLVHLEHQPQRFRLDVRDAVTGKKWHKILDERFFGRNSTSSSFFAFVWDGTTFSGSGKKTFTVPDGQYIVTLSVLKALGEEHNPAHTEVWESPLVTIDRP